ncbi:alginate export protein [Sinobacterium caligoides]|uniref:Alginate export protein n=1 Tax=Sinobacterium caligoides TaxID=933926 RepID=A0A3N2DP99_9GAMM|nr:alginate export family protein [Sinobacterium caligoides]ROS01641.1 alginate export protein [Sinobacterium caligoides]
MKFPSSRKPLFCAISMIITAVSTTKALAEDAFYEALSSGETNFDLRMRYENVDQDGIKDDADGLTVRTRLGYTTGGFHGVTAVVELEDSRTVMSVDEFSPNKSGYPVIADTPATNLNQAYLKYQASNELAISGGRQRIILDNARFVGNVGWRQNEQTFDAGNIAFKNDAISANLIWIDQVNNIFDQAIDTDSLLANASYQFTGIGKLTGYYYDLENEDTPAALATNSETLGIRFAGDTALSDSVKLNYAAEYAQQDTNASNSSNYSADYLLAELGAELASFNFGVGYELLGSDNGDYGFSTPLATGHAFNGWADKFLATPSAGLQDIYFKVGTELAGIQLAAVYHDFSADDSSSQLDNYGDEIDLLAVKNFNDRYKLGFKYASYSADDYQTDTNKAWLWGEMKF